MSTVEVLKNVYIDRTVTRFFEDPNEWIENRDTFPVRHVGGIHNLSFYDKHKWASHNKDPLRIIETITGREEIWFPTYDNKSPTVVYLSVNSDGKLHSHNKYSSVLPAIHFKIERRGRAKPVSQDLYGLYDFNHLNCRIWYDCGIIARSDDEYIQPYKPAVFSDRMFLSVQDEEMKEIIDSIVVADFSETWRHGEWKDTKFTFMNIIFTKHEMQNPATREKAATWISNHCKGGFFPLADKLFGDPEERFMFIADIAS